MKWPYILVLAFTFWNEALHSQFGQMPLNRDLETYFVDGLADVQYNFHPSLKTWDMEEIDSLSIRLQDMNLETSSTLVNLLINADTGSTRKEQIGLGIAPVFHSMFSFGMSNDSSDTGYQLGLGLRLSGFAGKKLTFGFEYTYSSNQYADYVEERIEQNGVLPGMGKASRHSEGYRNKFYSGYLHYKAADFLRLETGIGKHFIGNGYRSLILSDNSFVYPYFKLNVEIWKFNYQVLYAFMENLDYTYPYDVTRRNRKYSTSNLLSMNIGKKLNIGLFQSVVWYHEDETGRKFDVNYLNPVIFMRPVEFSIGSPDNILMGLDMKYRFYRNYSLYGQVILDEFLLNEIRADSGWWANKYGFQLGLKGHDVFKIEGLSFLVEYNWLRPFTYSHSNTSQNYSHYNEAMAHTFGANFNEGICRITYVKKRFLFSFHSVLANQGLDFPNEDRNYGGNIFRSNADNRMDYGNETGQGWSSNLQYLECKMGYLISPDAKWCFQLGVSQRNRDFAAYGNQDSRQEKNTMFHIGIKTLLHNQYLDF